MQTCLEAVLGQSDALVDDMLMGLQASLVAGRTKSLRGAPNAQSGLLYNDRRLGLNWPLPVTAISEKDRNYRLLDEWEAELNRRMTLLP